MTSATFDVDHAARVARHGRPGAVKAVRRVSAVLERVAGNAVLGDQVVQHHAADNAWSRELQDDVGAVAQVGEQDKMASFIVRAYLGVKTYS